VGDIYLSEIDPLPQNEVASKVRLPAGTLRHKENAGSLKYLMIFAALCEKKAIKISGIETT
jgi:predicted DNA-binding protein (UPF0251 family)